MTFILNISLQTIYTMKCMYVTEWNVPDNNWVFFRINNQQNTILDKPLITKTIIG